MLNLTEAMKPDIDLLRITLAMEVGVIKTNGKEMKYQTKFGSQITDGQGKTNV